VKRFTLAPVMLLLIASAGCGGGSSSGAATHKSATFTASLGHQKATVHGHLVTASVEATYGGGRPGRKLNLFWGLVDAVSGIRASEGEKKVATLRTTAVVQKRQFSVTFNPHTPTDYVVHFSLATAAGVFLAGKDTDVFTYP
jgi:hypothetical protein